MENGRTPPLLRSLFHRSSILVMEAAFWCVVIVQMFPVFLRCILSDLYVNFIIYSCCIQVKLILYWICDGLQLLTEVSNKFEGISWINCGNTLAELTPACKLSNVN